jgi:predicted branched-subunit amino acid permease
MKKAFNRSDFSEGFLDGLPIGLGYLSVSFAFGIFALGEGLTVVEALLISMLNVTSAGQLAAVPIIATLGSYVELILTQLVINLRYSLMSTSLSQRLDKSVSTFDRFVVSFMNTDEVFGVSMSKGRPLSRAYLYGLIILPYLGWTLGTLLGAVAGNILPVLLISALGIAIYGMFIAIVVPETRENKFTLLAVLLAVVLSLLFYYLPYLNLIPRGFVIIIVAAISAAVFAFVAPIKEEEND